MSNNQTLAHRPAKAESVINSHLTKHSRQGQDFRLPAWQLGRPLQLSDQAKSVKKKKSVYVLEDSAE